MAKYKKTLDITNGEKIRKRRKELGYSSQLSFAEAIGADRVTVSRWETGEYGIGQEHFESVKKVLKVDDSFFTAKPISGTIQELSKVITEQNTMIEDLRAKIENMSTIDNAINEISPELSNRLVTGLKEGDPALIWLLHEAVGLSSPVEPDLIKIRNVVTKKKKEVRKKKAKKKA